jgi:hypothetical protein
MSKVISMADNHSFLFIKNLLHLSEPGNNFGFCRNDGNESYLSSNPHFSIYPPRLNK